MSERIAKIRKKIIEHKLDALFVTNQHNVSYLTGFLGLAPHEREGFFLITLKNAYLLTFPTYFGLYEKGGKGFTTLNITRTKRLTDHLGEIFAREKIRKTGLEKENMTLAELASLKNKFQPKADRPLAEKISFIETSGIIEKQRLIKDQNELENIRRAARIADRAFDFIKKKIKKGVTEKKLALELEYFIKKNADDVAFAPIIAFNENAAVPHYLPSKDKRLTESSLILLDFGAKINGYCSDMTRVIFFGNPKAHWLKIYDTVLESQKRAIAKLCDGVQTKFVDEITRQFIRRCGFPEYPHGVGHGVGLAIHEAPKLRHDSKEKLRENMVITVEPGIYLPGYCGIRIEDLVVLKRGGIEILSKSPKLLKEIII